MTTGDWFKSFGEGKKETYYRIERIKDEETVLVEYFDYDTLFRMIRSSDYSEYSYKDWLEMMVNNHVYPIKQEEVPFLLTI